MKKIALIMAGGTGAKLWPKSTEKTPKQFNHMVGEGTLLQNTYQRLSGYFNTDDIFIVTQHSLAELVKSQIYAIRDENIIVEPFARNTAPAVALAYELLSNRGYSDEDIMYVFPSDHVIQNLQEFYLSIETAADFAYSRKAIMTIGIKPTRPETQYGYVQVKGIDSNLKTVRPGLLYCKTFAEKPDINTARRFIDSGDFLWNSGIFVWRMDTFKAALDKYLPEYSEKFYELGKAVTEADFTDRLTFVYKQINSISLDYGILEKADNVFCTSASFSWSDLSTWDEIYRLTMKDANNNSIEGDVVSINNKNTFIVSNGKIIGAYGLENVIIIDTEEALLVCRLGESEKVQDIVDYMRRKNINLY